MPARQSAIRHTPHGGRIRLSVGVQEQTVTLGVEDSGPGIPPDERDHVFERFVRLETSQSTECGGLGLPIARWIAEQHRGTLRVAASTEGTSLVATLPRART